MTSNIQIYWQAILRNVVKNTPLPPDFAMLQKALKINAAQTQTDLANAKTYLLNRAIAATAPACKNAIAARDLAQNWRRIDRSRNPRWLQPFRQAKTNPTCLPVI